MSAPAISVIMSVYNDAPFLRASLDSIVGQSFRDFELLVCNDGSRDGSAEILDEYAASDPRVRVFHRTNHGLVASLNFLIDTAQAPLLARMDGDDISRPERFARQVAYLADHSDIIVLGTNTDEIDTRDHVTPCHDYHPLTPEAVRQQLRVKSALCHPSVMMRADAVRAAHGYRTAFRHCEDYDLWLRLSERGDLANIEDRLLLYRRSPGQVSKRHTYTQTLGAAMAQLAHDERLAGHVDPFDGRDALPLIEELDTMLGRPGLARDMRASLVPQIQYSREAMESDGYWLIRDHVRDGGDRAGLWKTVARLVKMGLFPQALGLGRALLS